MLYKELVEIYEPLEKTSKRLEKTYIISKLLKDASEENLEQIIHLLQGVVFPPWDERKLGMSNMLTIKALNSVTGVSKATIQRLWKKTGDLGIVASLLIKEKKQRTLLSKKLTVEMVFNNLRKLAGLTGKGTVNRKIQLVAELISNAEPLEVKFIIKTVLEQLRIGLAEGILRDAIVWTYYPKIIGLFFRCEKCKSIMPKTVKCYECGALLNPKFKLEIEKKFTNVLEVKSVKDITDLDGYDYILSKNESLAREIYNLFIEEVQKAYDLTNDLGLVAHQLKTKGIKNLSKIDMKVGFPINCMLAIKTETIGEGFKSLGKPILCEYKLDGFRVQIHRDGDKFWLFTRRLENVTKQFREVIPLLKNNIKGNTYVLDSEIIGVSPKTGKYMPFQTISQRIKRKYDIEKLAKEIPVEVNLFDVIYYNDKSFIKKTQSERRKFLEKIVKEKAGRLILTKKLVTDNEEEVKKFFNKALDDGAEGLILKNLNKGYTPGRRVGGWLKLKPTMESLDLVIVGATWGRGKRSGVLSSFILACRDEKNERFLECGMMGTGIKEKGEGISFKELTRLIKPHIIEEKGMEVKIKPKIVIEVGYGEIQKSPTYNSGFALRFPKLIRLRLDRRAEDCDTLNRVKKLCKQPLS